jgi:hypothetical protein
LTFAQAIGEHRFAAGLCDTEDRRHFISRAIMIRLGVLASVIVLLCGFSRMAAAHPAGAHRPWALRL